MALPKNSNLHYSIAYSQFLMFKFKRGTLAPPLLCYELKKIKERRLFLASAKPAACGSTTCSSASSTCVAESTKTDTPIFLSVVISKAALLLNGGFLTWMSNRAFDLSRTLNKVYRFYTTKSEEQLFYEKQDISQAWLGVGTLAGLVGGGFHNLAGAAHHAAGAAGGVFNNIAGGLGNGGGFIAHRIIGAVGVTLNYVGGSIGAVIHILTLQVVNTVNHSVFLFHAIGAGIQLVSEFVSHQFDRVVSAVLPLPDFLFVPVIVVLIIAFIAAPSVFPEMGLSSGGAISSTTLSGKTLGNSPTLISSLSDQAQNDLIRELFGKIIQKLQVLIARAIAENAIPLSIILVVSALSVLLFKIHALEVALAKLQLPSSCSNTVSGFNGNPTPISNPYPEPSSGTSEEVVAKDSK